MSPELRGTSLIRPADAAALIADPLTVLSERMRRDPELQRELLRVLTPIVRMVPDRRWFD